MKQVSEIMELAKLYTDAKLILLVYDLNRISMQEVQELLAKGNGKIQRKLRWTRGSEEVRKERGVHEEKGVPEGEEEEGCLSAVSVRVGSLSCAKERNAGTMGKNWMQVVGWAAGENDIAEAVERSIAEDEDISAAQSVERF
ncbi:hypothetical protein BDZ91DRAFT_788963 [Kalaharituber pfeilii]|nr:hypothetical protein BDZ91DRAFT_788963 [Kalaharituber pfeilii]